MTSTKRDWRDYSQCEICLINPPWFIKYSNIWHGIKATMPPLGLLSIAAYLEYKGKNLAIIDINAEKLSPLEMEERISKLQPKIIGITVMTATAIQSNLIARLAKKVNSSIKIIMGGVHAETLPEECLSNNAVDIVVRGDGEITFYTLCEAILQEKSYKHIAGISFRDIKDNKVYIVHNQSAEFIHDLNQLPMPSYHLVPIHRYSPAIGAYRNLPAINMLMTRGCLGKCSFCNSANTPIRSRDAGLVVEEISKLKKQYGIKEIQFYDDTFTAIRDNVLKFCSLMKEKKMDISWAAFTRVDCINEKMAREMKKAGCHQIMLGIESGEAEALRRMSKPLQLKQTARVVKIIRNTGIEVRCAFVYGTEGETAASMQKTLDFALKLKPDLAIFNIATPYPGTQLYKWAKLNGYLLHEDWSRYELGEPVIRLPTVSPEKVIYFYKKSFKAFYRKPEVIWKRMRRIYSFRHLLDTISVFSFIMFGYEFGSQKFISEEEWLSYKKNDFFDYPFYKEIDFTTNPASPALLIRESHLST